MDFLNNIWTDVQTYLPSILGALAILIVGWIVARVVAAIVRAALRKTTLDERIGGLIKGTEPGAKSANVADVASKVTFYTIMLFVLVAFFQALNLTIVTEPINSLLQQVFSFAPRLLGAAILFVIAWLIAKGVRTVTTKALVNTGLDEKVSEASAEGESVPLSQNLGEVAYWLVFLLFLPAILGTLALDGLLTPVQSLLDKLLLYLPNVISAAAILVIGWFVARIIQRIVAGLLGAAGLDRLSAKVGFDKALGEQSLSGLVALVLYMLILLPVIVASLNALGLDAVTEPVSNLLSTMLGALPGLFAAAVVLGIAYAVGKIVSGLLTNVLSGLGFDNLFAKLGLKGAATSGAGSPSAIAGTLVLVAIMLFAAVEAATLTGLTSLAQVFTELTAFGGRALMALVIFGAGLYLANLATSNIEASGAKHSGFLSWVTRAAILILTGAMALRQLGVADEIITLAFGLSLGSVAVATAIAFGIGGRDIAAKELEGWRASLKG